MQIISISLTDEEKKRFEAVAKALGISKSELFRRIFKHWSDPQD